MTEISAFGVIREGKVFRNAFLEFPEKEIGEVRESEGETFSYFQGRFDLIEKDVAKVEAKINEATNKGSYLMKILHLKNTIPTADALGDFEALYNKVCAYEQQLEALISQNRVKNLEIKTALLADLTEATKSSEWKSATEKVKLLQSNWTKTGAVAEDKKEAIEGSYKELIDGFYGRRASFYADLEKMMVEKEANYEAFLKEAAVRLKGVPVSGLKSLNAGLMEEWKSLGRIKREKQNEFWAQFQALTKSAWNEARKTKKAANKSDLGANKKNKEEFIEKLQSLNKDLVPKVDLNAIKTEWRALGPVSKQDMNELQSAYLMQYDMLSEKLFLNSMVDKRLKGKDQGKDRNRLRNRILRDLLDRDTRELNAFKENLEKFNTSGGFHEMIGGKLEQQERKVKVKKMILNQLRSSE
ncbi:MAG: DUF349 domain-containing protein [Roseivirga sp.]|nr:DUF349 domain-containing protein [Roseivirga sp.]